MEENMRSRFELEKEAADMAIPRRRATTPRTAVPRTAGSRAAGSRVSEQRASVRRGVSEPRYRGYYGRASSRQVTEDAPALFSKEMLVRECMVCIILITAVLAIRIIKTAPTENLRVRLKDAISTQMTWAEAGVYLGTLKDSVASVGNTVKTIFGEEPLLDDSPATANELPTTDEPTVANELPTTEPITANELPMAESITNTQNYNDAIVDDETLQQLHPQTEEAEKK